MTRVAVLRAGYGAFVVAFVSLAASAAAGAFLLAALAAGLLGALLLAFSDDDLPKWAGLAFLAYLLLIVVAFLLASPATIRVGGAYGIEQPNPELASTVVYYLGLASPLMMAGTALAAAWEREQAPRLLLMGALGGFVVVALLTMALRPSGSDATQLARSAAAQGNLLLVLGALSAVSGAAGAAWSAARPEEFA